MNQDQVVRTVGQGRTENPVLSRPWLRSIVPLRLREVRPRKGPRSGTGPWHPAWFRTRDEATSGSGESHAGSRRRRGDCSPAGRGPPAFLPVGGAHHRPPFPNQEGVEGRLPRPGDRRLGPHIVLRLPDNGRNLVAPGCVECRALPHFALWCAAKVRDYWRRGLRIPYHPLINTFFLFVRIIGVYRLQRFKLTVTLHET